MNKEFRYTDIRTSTVPLTWDDSQQVEQVAPRIARECEGRSLKGLVLQVNDQFGEGRRHRPVVSVGDPRVPQVVAVA